MTRKRNTAPSQENPQPPEQDVGSGAASEDRDAFLRAVAGELQRARERAGVNLSELHRQTRISRTVLQGYERGRFAPGAWELKRLCEVLGVSPNRVLFGREDVREPRPGLASMLGDVRKAKGTAKLATVLQALSGDEMAAFLTLVETIVVHRVGGTEKLQEAMRMADAFLGGDDLEGSVPEQAWERIAAMLSPEQLEEFKQFMRRAESYPQIEVWLQRALTPEQLASLSGPPSEAPGRSQGR